MQVQAELAEQDSRSSRPGGVTAKQSGSEESRWPLLRGLTHSLWRWHCATAGHAQPAQQAAASVREGELCTAYDAFLAGRRCLGLTHAEAEQLCAQKIHTQGPMTLTQPVLSVKLRLEDSHSPELELCASCCSGGIQRSRGDSDRVLQSRQPQAAGVTGPRQQGWQPAQELPPGPEQAGTPVPASLCVKWAVSASRIQPGLHQ